MTSSTTTDLTGRAEAARVALDAWVREVVAWHFNPATGCPFWLDFAAKRGWDPRRDVQTFRDLAASSSFEDEWLRGGPVQRWVPKGLAGKPIYVFETGGTTGIPKSRVGDRRLPHRLRAVQRHAAGRVLSPRAPTG